MSGHIWSTFVALRRPVEIGPKSARMWCKSDQTRLIPDNVRRFWSKVVQCWSNSSQSLAQFGVTGPISSGVDKCLPMWPRGQILSMSACLGPILHKVGQLFQEFMRAWLRNGDWPTQCPPVLRARFALARRENCTSTLLELYKYGAGTSLEEPGDAELAMQVPRVCKRDGAWRALSILSSIVLNALWLSSPPASLAPQARCFRSTHRWRDPFRIPR